MKIKKCKFCQKEIKGRADKKYCDNYCRSSFSNRIRKDSNKLIYVTNRILKKNRRILEALFLSKEGEENKFKSIQFLEMGYNFKFQTHWKEIELDKVCVCCYDYGYVQDSNGHLAIIRLNSLTFAAYD
jgi:hypothetical protein